MLNSLTSQYFVCRTCGVVDHNFKRMKIGEKCSECGVPSTGGQLHYSISFKTLVQLMEEMMELKPARAIDGPGPGIAVVLFFCTLTENLLDKFLLDLMKALKIPPRVQKRLLEDHRFVTQRVQKLFPSLAGEKWKDAISKISAANTSAYQAANDLYLQANGVRNDFLHAGQVWSVPDDLPEDCMRYTEPILSMFATLHNNYIAPHYNTERPYSPF